MASGEGEGRIMTESMIAANPKLDVIAGAVDCDVQIADPDHKALLPYLDDYWRDTLVQRGLPTFDSAAYPRNAPISVREDWRLPASVSTAERLAGMQMHLLDRHDISIAICNCLYGVQILHSEDMAVAFTRALNDWVAAEWLDRDPRLRASIVVPMQNPQMAVEEIE